MNMSTYTISSGLGRKRGGEVNLSRSDRAWKPRRPGFPPEIERAAADILDALYAAFPQIRRIRCTVSKLAPPLGGKVEKASVVLER